MAEYPIHNYGSDPLGRLGLMMMQSSLEWDDKQKLLERQALLEAAKNQREAAEKTATSGYYTGAASDLMKLGYDPRTAESLMNQNAGMQRVNLLKSLNEGAELSKKTQEYKNIEIENTQKAIEYWSKQKSGMRDIGMDVTGINDNLSILGKKISELTGLKIDPVAMTDISELKKTLEAAAIQEVSKLERDLIEAQSKGDIEGASKSAAALSAQITRSSKSLNLPKDYFASAAQALTQYQQELPKMMADKVKGKDLKYHDAGDRIIVTDDKGNEVKSYTKGATPKSADEKETLKVRDWQNYNKSLVSQGQKPVTYTYYVDNIAAKFDLGKMLFGDGGIPSIPNNKPEETKKVKVEGNFAVVDGKKYPIVNGVVNVNGKKYRVTK